MPNSLKNQLKKLGYEDKITEEELNELLDKLEGHDRELTNQTGWVPVSERLPEEPGHYLVTMKHNDISFVDQNWYDGEGNNEYMDNFWRNSSNIIAWMPLPEPYKKEGDSNE